MKIYIDFDGVIHQRDGVNNYSITHYPAAKPGSTFTAREDAIYLHDAAFTGTRYLKTVNLARGTTYITGTPFENSSVENLNYNGTKAEWNANSSYRDYGWNYGANFTYITCTDGIVYL